MIVPAQQPRAAPCALALLGEAPGQEESERGEPFIGPSGQVLDAGLRAAGINRRDCWIGNVFDEKAPGNDVGPWLRDPARVDGALARLAADLARAQPTVIVPLGGTALWALTGSDAIMKAAGAPALASRVVPGTKLVPTWHPAFVMRNWKHLAFFIGHLAKAGAEAARGPELRAPWVELTVEPTLEDVKRWMWQGKVLDGRGQVVPSLMHTDLLSVDIETGWGQITCVGFAPDAEHALCVPFVDLRKPSRSYWATEAEELEAWQLVKTVLESPVPKLLQHGVYDAYWLLVKMGIRVLNYRHDTRLMSHAHLPEAARDLGTLAATYTELPGWKSWGGRGAEEKRDA